MVEVADHPSPAELGAGAYRWLIRDGKDPKDRADWLTHGRASKAEFRPVKDRMPDRSPTQPLDRRRRPNRPSSMPT